MPRADAANDKSCREIRRRERMRQAVRERRVENNFYPIDREELSIRPNDMALRGVHPAIHG